MVTRIYIYQKKWQQYFTMYGMAVVMSFMYLILPVIQVPVLTVIASFVGLAIGGFIGHKFYEKPMIFIVFHSMAASAALTLGIICIVQAASSNYTYAEYRVLQLGLYLGLIAVAFVVQFTVYKDHTIDKIEVVVQRLVGPQVGQNNAQPRYVQN